MSINKSLRNSVWIKYIGQEVGIAKCLCCGLQEINQANFECGHVISRATGGPTTLENLRPICGLCNKSMTTENMDVFRKRCGYDKTVISTTVNFITSALHHMVFKENLHDVKHNIFSRIKLFKKNSLNIDNLDKFKIQFDNLISDLHTIRKEIYGEDYSNNNKKIPNENAIYKKLTKKSIIKMLTDEKIKFDPLSNKQTLFEKLLEFKKIEDIVI